MLLDAKYQYYVIKTETKTTKWMMADAHELSKDHQDATNVVDTPPAQYFAIHKYEIKN